MNEIIWVAVASIASSIAVIISIISFISQKKSSRPLVTPIPTRINTELPKITGDWKTHSKINNKFCNTTITVQNIGGGLAHDILYNFEFNNYQMIVKEINEIKLIEGYNFRLECSDYKEHKYEMYVQDKHSARWFRKTQKYVRNIPPLQNGEKIKIPLPSYFIVMTNAILRFGYFSPNYLKVFPEIILDIEYRDVTGKKYKHKYLIKWSGRISTKNISLEYKENQYFESELVSTQIK